MPEACGVTRISRPRSLRFVCQVATVKRRKLEVNQ
jgi:hypothetical protein